MDDTKITIREARKNAGVTQDELAREVGVTQGAVTQWETGRAAPSLPMFIKVAQALGCSLDDLVDSPDDESETG